MKLVRFLLIGAAVAFVLVLGIVGVVFNSRFQTWMVRRNLAGRPGIQATVGKVSAGLHHIHIDQLKVASGGATAVFPSVDIDLPVTLAAGGRVQISKLVAKGWTVDLTASSPAPPAASLASPAAAIPGFMNRLNLPFDLAVDSVDLDGELIVAGATGQTPVHAKVTVAGGGLGAGRDARFNVAASAVLGPGSVVSAVEAKADVSVTMTTPRTFSGVAVQAALDARGPKLPENTRLALAISATRANSGENYALAVESSGRPVVTLSATVPATGLAGTWQLDVTDADLGPFALGRALPVFSAKGAGKVGSDAKLSAFMASGHLEGAADKLSALRPELAATGALKYAVDFDVSQDGDSWRVAALAGDVTAAQPVLSVRALQPFVFNPGTRALKASDASQDLLVVDLKGLPLSWAAPLAEGTAITGDLLRGSFAFGARDGGFAGRSTTPVSVGNVSLSQQGKPLLRRVDLSLDVSGDYTPQGWQVVVANLATRSAGATVLSGELRAGQLSGKDQPVRLQANWTADLPALLAQPAASGVAALKAGRSSGDLMASIGARSQFQAKMAFADLAVDSAISAEPVPDVTAEMRVDGDTGGRYTLAIPILVERAGRKSDLTLSGTMIRTASSTTLDAALASGFFAVEDGQAFAAAFVQSAPGPGAPSAAADSAPFWSGLGGQVSVALKKLSYRQQVELTDVTGTLRIDQGALRIEGLHAGMGDASSLKAGGGVTFDAKEREPYALRADVTVENLDSGPLFVAIDPSRLPTVEARFSISSQLASRAATAGQLVGRMGGEFQVSSRSGVFRALRADISDKIQATQSRTAAGLSALGAFTGNEKVSNLANRSQILSEIAKKYEAVPFDQLSVTVARDEKLNLVLKDFSLIGREHRITGSGEIRHTDGLPLLAQPLDLRLQLASSGETAELLKRANLLDGKQDTLGYSQFISPIRLTGTLENPDAGEFKAALVKAAEATLLDRLIR